MNKNKAQWGPINNKGFSTFSLKANFGISPWVKKQRKIFIDRLDTADGAESSIISYRENTDHRLPAGSPGHLFKNSFIFVIGYLNKLVMYMSIEYLLMYGS